MDVIVNVLWWLFVFAQNSDEGHLEITGDKLSLNERNLNMYWTPAPPKWDIAPSHVKHVLFRQYHGAEYIPDGYVPENLQEEKDEVAAENIDDDTTESQYVHK